MDIYVNYLFSVKFYVDLLKFVIPIFATYIFTKYSVNKPKKNSD